MTFEVKISPVMLPEIGTEVEVRGAGFQYTGTIVSFNEGEAILEVKDPDGAIRKFFEKRGDGE